MYIKLNDCKFVLDCYFKDTNSFGKIALDRKGYVSICKEIGILNSVPSGPHLNKFILSTIYNKSKGVFSVKVEDGPFVSRYDFDKDFFGKVDVL